MNKSKIKAVALFSGGLDSLLAIKLIESQGIEVSAINFKSTFFSNKKNLKILSEKNNIKLNIIDISREYLKIIKNPRYGYGKNLNPCIDCKIFMLQQAQKYAEKINAHFIFTGEVIGQRPKSQHKQSLEIIEKRSGLKGKLLRPLSAKLMTETEVEKIGLVNRNKLLDFNGRNRTPQLHLAKKFGITYFNTPGGGCMLTETDFCRKLKDIKNNTNFYDVNTILLLQNGRYFRIGQSLIFVGKNKSHNEKIQKLKKIDDFLIKIKGKIPGPLTLIRGEKSERSIKLAGGITARYTKNIKKETEILYGKNLENTMIIKKLSQEIVQKLMI